MTMTARNRANGKHSVGFGGRWCSCCDTPPRMNKRVRRSVKRGERQAWRREAVMDLMDMEVVA